MDSQTTKRRELVRGLDLSAATALVVGTMIGTGVFLKTARMAQAVGTPLLVLLAWVAAGLLSLAGALSYAELGAMLPKAGGEYVYLRAAYGDMPAFFFGWMRLVIGSSGSIASFGAAFATFLSALVPMSSAGMKATSVTVILFFSAVNCLRVTIGGRVQSVLTLGKVLAIASIAGGVFFFAPSASWQHLQVPPGVPAWCGLPAFGAAMLSALWAFDGWNDMPMAAGEVRDPGRNVPRALILGMAIVLLVYGLVNLAYCYALPMSEIANASSPSHDTALPVAAKAAQTFLPHFGAQWVALATMLSTIGALNGCILASARIPFAMARDGLFFASFARLGERSAVPVVSILAQGVWAALLVIMAKFDQLTDCVVFAGMIFYASTTAAVFVLRKKQPNLPRPYKTLGYPVVPLLFIAVAIWLLINTLRTSPLESAVGLGLIALGLPVYLWQRRTAGTR
ncbi:MAG TPA: amino acid permease [Candidatus Cybelea sp.]|nr:amino acid permease [Candidatus Cybelea sp.]